MSDAQTAASMYTKIRRIAEKAKEEPTLRFNSLAHLITVDLLRDGYRELRKGASPGVDGVTAEEYEGELEKNLRELHGRLKEGRYRAQPVKRVYIDKEGGKKRPLGIPALEDKIVQRAALYVLEAIYEQDFLPCSYGFRPKRGAQDALEAVDRAIMRGKVNFILDADIKGYFDNIVRKRLMELIRMRVIDGRLLRLLGKWLHVGVVEGGRLLPTTKGTPQGAVISPWMANVYLHYVLDLWLETEMKPRLKGEVYLIRYADDFVIGFQSKGEAKWVLRELRKRFAEFGLELNEEKTRLIRFGRFAEDDLKQGGGGKPETFDFLGFTHICSRTRTGKFTVKVRTMRKRVQRFLMSIERWCRENRHAPLDEQQEKLSQKLKGHYGYYGRIGNYRSLHQVHRRIRWIWRQWLNRRDQQRHMTWGRFALAWERYPLPRPRITQRWRPPLLPYG